jgi:hypothetical protein
VKVLTTLLLCVAIALGVFIYRQSVTIEGQQTRLSALESQLSAENERAKSATLDLQSKCSEQARKAFAEIGYKSSDGAAYQNHYSARLNKCFIETDKTAAHEKTIWRWRNLFDAFEGKQYGTFAWRNQGEKKYWEVAPYICNAIAPNGETKQCASEDEFSSLIRTYMEAE